MFRLSPAATPWIQPLNTKNRILTGKYWDWASENKNCVKACEICDPTKLVWASSEHFWRFYGNFIILAYSRNSADKQKITKMFIESWKMVGFHFLKKEKKLQLEPDRMNYSLFGIKLGVFRSKIDICVKFWLPRQSTNPNPNPKYLENTNFIGQTALAHKLSY